MLCNEHLRCNIVRIPSVQQGLCVETGWKKQALLILPLVNQLMAPDCWLKINDGQPACRIKDGVRLGSSLDVAMHDFLLPKCVQTVQELTHIAHYARLLSGIDVDTQIWKDKGEVSERVVEMSFNLYHIAKTFQVFVIQIQFIHLLILKGLVCWHGAAQILFENHEAASVKTSLDQNVWLSMHFILHIDFLKVWSRQGWFWNWCGWTHWHSAQNSFQRWEQSIPHVFSFFLCRDMRLHLDLLVRLGAQLVPQLVDLSPSISNVASSVACRMHIDGAGSLRSFVRLCSHCCCCRWHLGTRLRSWPLHGCQCSLGKGRPIRRIQKHGSHRSASQNGCGSLKSNRCKANKVYTRIV